MSHGNITFRRLQAFVLHESLELKEIQVRCIGGRKPPAQVMEAKPLLAQWLNTGGTLELTELVIH